MSHMKQCEGETKGVFTHFMSAFTKLTPGVVALHIWFTFTCLIAIIPISMHTEQTYLEDT